MSWGQIKKAVNSDLSVPLNEQINTDVTVPLNIKLDAQALADFIRAESVDLVFRTSKNVGLAMALAFHFNIALFSTLKTLDAIMASEAAFAAIVESEAAFATIMASETALAAVAASTTAMTACLGSVPAKLALHASEMAETAIRNSPTALSVMDTFSVTNTESRTYTDWMAYKTYYSGKSFLLSFTRSVSVGNMDVRTATHVNDFIGSGTGGDVNRMYEPLEGRGIDGTGAATVSVTAKWVVMDA